MNMRKIHIPEIFSVLAAALLLAAACGSDNGSAGDGWADGSDLPDGGDWGFDPFGDDMSGSDLPDAPHDPGEPEEICADVTLTVTPPIPTVVIILDQSGSMDSEFGDTDRWNAVRNSLLDMPDAPGGLIYDLDEIIAFGLALYTSNSGAPPCPIVEWMPPAIGNYGTIEDVYEDEEPLRDTPTGESIDAVTDMLLGIGWEHSAAYILTTDGEPDTCANPSPDTEAEREAARAVTVNAVHRAFSLGIDTYVISVGEGSVSAAHLQDIANAGLGITPPDPDAPYWEAGDEDDLSEALRSIVGDALPCIFELNGRITALEDACFGTVVLNGRELPCDDPNGWHAVDETHIELTGEACEEIQSGEPVDLSASFPCDIATLY